jgi:hypothetical protein
MDISSGFEEAVPNRTLNQIFGRRSLLLFGFNRLQSHSSHAFSLQLNYEQEQSPNLYPIKELVE